MTGTAWSRLLLAVLLAGVDPAPVGAQSGLPRPPKFEISGGAALVGGGDFGRAAANLTANEPSAPDVALFHTETALDTGFGVEGRIAWLMTSRLAAEGGVGWTRQTLETRITADAEGAADSRATQDVDSYVVDGALVVHLPEAAFAGGRGLPFVAAGGGYLRQLDDQSQLLGTGGVFQAGGGLKYFPGRPRGTRPGGLGLRVDARLEVRTGGLEIDRDGSSRMSWRLDASGIFRF